jgi:Fe-S-cluster containining protein
MRELYQKIATQRKSAREIASDKLLELAASALAWTDTAIAAFTSNDSLPEPLACKPGCHYCCFNQPMLTPPEALLVGHHVENTFTDRGRQELLARIEETIRLTKGKGCDEIVKMRHELPCVFLQDGMCLVYGVRPSVCRACSSTSAEHCRRVFEARDVMARLRCYPQIREIHRAVQTSLLDYCRKLGCQSDLLQLAEAIGDYCNHPRPVEAWTKGEVVFDSAQVD